MKIKTLLLLINILAFGLVAQAQNPFITTWDTYKSGITDTHQIMIPTHPDEVYDYDIYWEDTTETAIHSTIIGVTGDTVISFPKPGIYRVSITGTFPRIYFANTNDDTKILSIDQWGDNQWTSMNQAFYGCYNLQIPAIDAPDLSNVEDLSRMFLSCSSLNSPIGHWDVSNITNMNAMFTYASKFNQDIGDWDVRRVKDMTLMFQSATSFNQDIGDWEVDSVTSMYGLFYWPNNFNQDISRWNVSNVTNMSYMFLLNGKFNQDISGWDVSSVTQMSNMFSRASSFDQNLGEWDVSNVEVMTDMLKNSGLSVYNYDSTLVGWSQLDSLQEDVVLGASGLNYCTSENNRQSIIDSYGWDIQSDEKNCELITGFTNGSSIDNINQLTIYPNPSSGNITIPLANEEIESVNITNMLGKRETFFSNVIETTLSGILILEINTISGNQFIERIEVIH